MDGFARPCHHLHGKNSCAPLEKGEFEPASRALSLTYSVVCAVANVGSFCSANFPAGVNQNQNQNQIVKEDEGGSTWLASLWAYVESIPATPASASENTALVNRAFERMSSFGRIGGKVKVNAGDTSLASVLCAILWVWTGTSVGYFTGIKRKLNQQKHFGCTRMA
ncbi:hypothetical protein CsSME_00014447 [Camellia sinensis var. sinensis]